MRIWPRSLQGQLLLAVAVALLLGQTVNAVLLYRAQAERREAALIHTLAFRLFAQLRDPAGPPVTATMRRPPPEVLAGAFPGSFEAAAPALLPTDRRQPEQEAALRALFAGQGVTLGGTQIVIRPVETDPAAQRRLERWQRRQSANRAAAARLPRHVIVAAARRDNGDRWAVARVLVPPPPARPLLGLILQTIVIYALLVGAIALILRQLTRPLAALTRRVDHFARTRDATDPLDPAGPDDLRQLIAAHTALEGRIVALLDEKDVMLGAIGHDLRTPLAALRVRIEAVADPVERQRMAATIDDIARSLDDMLSLARVGRPSDPLESTDLTALVAQVIEEFEDMGEPVSFPGAPRIVLALRPTWLRRALRNLIANALRHGGGTAEVTLQRHGDYVSVAVSDNGPGIPPAELERMLEPFARGDPSRNRASGGAGLGLTLARAIAEQHGGSLTLANRPGQDGAVAGLTATLVLPVT